ncbi:hypothetical protein JCM19233_5414 [Vibrio astriarenae]|nr:hypothetical protein JCM19233_5414 [Vibrio sp. C7]
MARQWRPRRRYIFICIALLLLFGAIATPLNQRNDAIAELEAHQIRADQLTVEQQTLLTQLKVAHEEIVDLHADNFAFDGADEWPLVEELESLYLPAFTQDLNWQNLAEIKWQNLEDGVYIGEAQNSDLMYSTFLLDSRISSEPVIWLHVDKESYSQDLIAQGWTEVVFVQTNRQSHHH